MGNVDMKYLRVSPPEHVNRFIPYPRGGPMGLLYLSGLQNLYTLGIHEYT